MTRDQSTSVTHRCKRQHINYSLVDNSTPRLMFYSFQSATWTTGAP